MPQKVNFTVILNTDNEVLNRWLKTQEGSL